MVTEARVSERLAQGRCVRSGAVAASRTRELLIASPTWQLAVTDVQDFSRRGYLR